MNITIEDNKKEKLKPIKITMAGSGSSPSQDFHFDFIVSAYGSSVESAKANARSALLAMTRDVMSGIEHLSATK